MEVLIQPPMPTASPSAMASAAATQCRRGDWRRVRSWSCWKHDDSQSSACLLSLRRCISARAGSARRTHWGLREGGMRGTSCLLCTETEPTSRSLDPAGTQRPAGWCETTASGVRLSTKRCQSLAKTWCSVPWLLRRSL